MTTSLFQPYVAYATGSHPAAVAIGDLDGDGRNDIAVLTSASGDPANDDMVNVFLQDTDGSLKPRVKYPVGAAGTSIDVGDVNGDGRVDVVVGLPNSPGPQIGVLLQTAAGTLDPMVSYPTANSASVKVGDFNGDGRMDVAGIGQGGPSNGLDVFLQTDTGVLAAPVTYAAPQNNGELDAGDVDGDGRTDLVILSGQSVAVRLQMPDGTLGAPASYSLSGGNSMAGVAVGDTNGDGRTDIVVSYGGNRPSSFIARFLQNAQGAMDPAVSYPSYDIPSAVILADMDGDGRKDVLVGHSAFGRLGVYRGYPSGDFVTEDLYTVPNAGPAGPQGLAVGDINGDSRPDAVIADSAAGLVVLRHVPDVSLALAVTAPAGGPYYTNVPLTVRWAAGDVVALAGFDVSVSFNNGNSYTPIAGCTGLPATANQCAWTPTGPAGSGIRVRVTARDGAGNSVFAETTFNLVTPSIALMAPSPMSSQYIGSPATITWSHNLPATDTVRIELSRDGGGSYELVAAAAPITTNGPGLGSFVWTVTGPATNNARVRVSSNDPSLPASGSNFSPFSILTPPALTVGVQTTGGVAYTTALTVAWTGGVPGLSTVRIELSRDGGATFETIAAAYPSIEAIFFGSVSGPSAADARVRVTGTNGSVPATGTSNSFTLVQPTVAVTSPAVGSVLYTGTPTTIAWSSNLPATSPVTVELSRDGGASYAVLGTSASNTGTFAWTVTGPAAGTALVRVTVGGPGSTAGTSGAFSIAVPSLTVTSPASGAAVYAGASLAITWSTNLPGTSPVTVELSRDGGSTYAVLATNAPNTGSFTWGVTGPSTGAAIVRVTVGGPASMAATSGAFAITVPSLTVTSPAAGAAFYAGTPLAIAWSTNLPGTSPVTIELSRDGGSTYAVLATNVPNTGSFAGVVTGPDSAAVVARVSVTSPVVASGTSGTFAIVTPALTVTGPAAGALAYTGASLAITWSTNMPAASPVLVELSRDGGGTFETLAAAAPNTGSFAWVVTGPDSAAVTTRVTVTDPVAVTGTGGTFAIAAPSLTVTGPAAGALVYAGTPVTITWTDNLPASDPVSIELSRDGGATFQFLSAAAANTGSFVWTASGPDTTAARVRVTWNGAASASAVGPAFQILTATMAVTSPAAGANWAVGTSRTISWSSNLAASATVLVELSRDGGGSWATLASAAPASGSIDWTVTGPATSSAIVRVSANGGVPAVATSAVFTIGNPALSVTSPATGASWTIGIGQTITWTSNLLPTATVKIELSRNGGSTYTTLASSAPNSGSFAWTATGPSTTTAMVRVSANGFTATGVSGRFSLVAASVHVTSPNTAVTWTVGTVRAITWTHNLGASAQFKIEVSRNGVWSTITSAVTGGGATSGSTNWTVAAPRTSNARIRVTWTGGSTVTDTSDVSFQIN